VSGDGEAAQLGLILYSYLVICIGAVTGVTRKWIPRQSKAAGSGGPSFICSDRHSFCLEMRSPGPVVASDGDRGSGHGMGDDPTTVWVAILLLRG